MMARFPSYQTGLAVLMGLTGSVVFFDRAAIGFLSPFIVADMKLSNAQIGLASSILALSWAAGCYVTGRIADRTGRRKAYMIMAIVAFSLCSMATGLAGGFAVLMLARLVMGATEAPVAVLCAAVLLEASEPARRGLNMGINFFIGIMIAGAAGPLVLVALATHFGWRAAFYMTGAPGLMAALAIALYVRELPRRVAVAPQARPAQTSARDVLRIRNVWLCAAIASLLLGLTSVGSLFAPLFLTKVRHLSPIDMALLFSVLGAATMVSALVLPTLSDRVGRKRVIAGIAGLGAVLPLGCLYWTGSLAGLAAIFAVLGLAFGLPPMVITIVPGESAGLRARATALGMVAAIAEVIGGFAAPALSGFAADRFGLAIPLIIAGGCGVGAAVVALALQETAPRRLGASGVPALALAPSE